jgi:hypothetical protein
MPPKGVLHRKGSGKFAATAMPRETHFAFCIPKF